MMGGLIGAIIGAGGSWLIYNEWGQQAVYAYWIGMAATVLVVAILALLEV
jgi:hypothetical protein